MANTFAVVSRPAVGNVPSPLSRVIENSENPTATPDRKDEPVTIVQAITEYLADAEARELADATIYKLDIFFRKQFLAWCKVEGYNLLRVVRHRERGCWRMAGRS